MGGALREEDRNALIAARPQDREAVTDSIIRVQFGESELRDEDKRAWLTPIVDDWLFDPGGRGARSGVPP
jgi:hypothetical protein